jgi:lipopolysaccharide biosynthesis glycosyltransferase
MSITQRKFENLVFLNEFSSFHFYVVIDFHSKKKSTRIAAVSSQVSFMKEKSSKKSIFKNGLMLGDKKKKREKFVVEACENHARCATENKKILHFTTQII